MVEFVDHLGNPVWPLDGRTGRRNASPLLPLWKRRPGVLAKVRRMLRFRGLGVTWDSEIAHEYEPESEGD